VPRRKIAASSLKTCRLPRTPRGTIGAPAWAGGEKRSQAEGSQALDTPERAFRKDDQRLAAGQGGHRPRHLAGALHGVEALHHERAEAAHHHAREEAVVELAAWRRRRSRAASRAVSATASR